MTDPEEAASLSWEERKSRAAGDPRGAASISPEPGGRAPRRRSLRSDGQPGRGTARQ